MWMVASSGPLIVVASSPADHLMVSLHLALVAEAVKWQGDPVDGWRPSRLWTNRGLPILPTWCRGEVRGGFAPSGGGTLGLLHRGGLEEIPELTADPSSLHGRGLGHCSDQHRRSRNILASVIEDWGLLTPIIIVDAVVNIAGPPPGSSAITATSLLLLESVSKLLQEELVLFDLGLKFMELLQV